MAAAASPDPALASDSSVGTALVASGSAAPAAGSSGSAVVASVTAAACSSAAASAAAVDSRVASSMGLMGSTATAGAAPTAANVDDSTGGTEGGATLVTVAAGSPAAGASVTVEGMVLGGRAPFAVLRLELLPVARLLDCPASPRLLVPPPALPRLLDCPPLRWLWPRADVSLALGPRAEPAGGGTAILGRFVPSLLMAGEAIRTLVVVRAQTI